MQLTLPLNTHEPTQTRFVRHRWARRYILRVLDDGTLRVTVPRRGSKREAEAFVERSAAWIAKHRERVLAQPVRPAPHSGEGDRKSTRLNSSHSQISYAVFCLKKKKKK